MFERPQRGERAVLLDVSLGRNGGRADQQEFEALATSAKAKVVADAISLGDAYANGKALASA